MHLVFKRDIKGAVEHMVKLLSGDMIHVDMVPEEPTPSAYTSYMFECFSKNPTENIYSQETHTILYLHLTEEENKRACDFLQSCVDKNTPYNYSDIFRCVLPGSSLLSDISGDNYTTLFCSQAAVLCLRKALDPTHGLHLIVTTLNSRITTPQTLFNSLLPFCTEVESIHSKPTPIPLTTEDATPDGDS